jgi:hypothetical protein
MKGAQCGDPDWKGEQAVKFIHDTIDVFGFLFYQAAYWFYLSSLIFVPVGFPLVGIYLHRKKKRFLGIISGRILFYISLLITALLLFLVARFGFDWFIRILDGNPVETYNFDGILLNWCLWILGSLSVSYLGMFIFGFKGVIFKILGCIALILGIYIYGLYLILRLFLNWGGPL